MAQDKQTKVTFFGALKSAYNQYNESNPNSLLVKTKEIAGKVYATSPKDIIDNIAVGVKKVTNAGKNATNGAGGIIHTITHTSIADAALTVKTAIQLKSEKAKYVAHKVKEARENANKEVDSIMNQALAQ